MRWWLLLPGCLPGRLFDGQASKTSAKQAVKRTVKDTVKLTVKHGVKRTVHETVKETVQETVKDTVKQTVKDTVKDMVKDTVRDTERGAPPRGGRRTQARRPKAEFGSARCCPPELDASPGFLAEPTPRASISLTSLFPPRASITAFHPFP